ncbi:metallophosphoesterase [Agrobacterium sp. BA1120]|uniref:metallophosphoesterase family protein n=1 Tax=Agrobacterium sp. BA1120 TaxID=3228927 RepID=UPI00336A7D05
MKIAVVADVHLHDLHGGYGMLEEGGDALALRTLEDTMASTRVFNESYPAFIAVLEDIVQRGIRDVVLLGDYSDDGQLGAVSAVKCLLSSYEEKHGLRFFLTFGNHDCYGPEPRHQAKRLTKTDGLQPVIVTSDEHADETALIRSDMRGMSTLEAMEAMANYGVARPVDVLHWETPFGDSDQPNDRRTAGSDASGLDASYLVEPQDGLWLLMLDANVFQKVGDVWELRADAAWDHVLAARPYLLEWITDVARRAAQSGKTLLAFSHYPALPLALAGEGDAVGAACTPDWLKRMPSPESGRQLAKAGIRWHFSGHMHVGGQMELDGLVNIAVPSPVAYPGGYAIVNTDPDKVDIETVQLDEVHGYDVAFLAYRAQTAHTSNDAFTNALAAPNYSGFLRAHLQNLIENRHLPEDWTPEFRATLDTSIGQLFDVDALGLTERWPQFTPLPLRQMVDDFYFLRADGAANGLSAEKIAFYGDLCAGTMVEESVKTSGLQDLLRFLELFRALVR